MLILKDFSFNGRRIQVSPSANVFGDVLTYLIIVELEPNRITRFFNLNHVTVEFLFQTNLFQGHLEWMFTMWENLESTFDSLLEKLQVEITTNGTLLIAIASATPS